MKDITSFETILRKDNNWKLFKILYKNKLSEHVIDEVEKMLKCCTDGCGFATYICPHDGEKKKISFSCKSKLCSRCGKKHSDIWANTVSEKLLNCDHRHIILTISDKLWPFFIDSPSAQKLLLDTAAKLITRTFRHHNKNKKITLGMILVLHPFGDDLKSNFHVHALVTAGGLSRGKFVEINFISYNRMRPTWQFDILSALKKIPLPAPYLKRKLLATIDWCFKYIKNGFNIKADSIIKGPQKFILKYIARYTRHPPISTRRIINYDGKYVTFTYKYDKKLLTKKMPKFEFINAVLLHTSCKHFKIIRRFGLYSRRSCKKYNQAKSFLPQSQSIPSPTFNWRTNVAAFTGHDPLICRKCGSEMELYSITYFDKFGDQKTSYQDVCFEDYHPPPKPPKGSFNETNSQRQLFLPGMSG